MGRLITGWSIALAMLVLRGTCRVRVHGDVRERLRADSQRYVYSILHAHQVAAAINTEPNTAAMVSRSADGELLLPAFRALGIGVVRGSNLRGGRPALETLVEHVNRGFPAILAVDGPRGPRGHVRKGIAVLSQRTGAVVLNVILVPSRRWVCGDAWDRFEIPKPFSRIDAYFDEPLRPRAGEKVEVYRQRIHASLSRLEQTCGSRHQHGRTRTTR